MAEEIAPSDNPIDNTGTKYDVPRFEVMGLAALYQASLSYQDDSAVSWREQVDALTALKGRLEGLMISLLAQEGEGS